MKNRYFNWNRNKMNANLTQETMEMLMISIKKRPRHWSTGCWNVPVLAKNTQAMQLNVCVVQEQTSERCSNRCDTGRCCVYAGLPLSSLSVRYICVLCASVAAGMSRFTTSYQVHHQLLHFILLWLLMYSKINTPSRWPSHIVINVTVDSKLVPG